MKNTIDSIKIKLNSVINEKHNDIDIKDFNINIYSIYLKLIKISLKNDVVAGVFIFGWLCTLFSLEILSFQFGSLTAQFYQILPKRQSDSLTLLCIRFGIFIFMMGLGKGCLLGTRGLLARAIRRNLTLFLHSKYVCLNGLKSIDIEIDNPDQRITDDVKMFSIGLLEIVEIVSLAPILIIFYTAQVIQKLDSLSVIIIYIHFLISVIVLRLGMGRLRNLTMRKEEREGQLRSEHVALHSNSESFVLTNSEGLLSRLQSNLNDQVHHVLSNSKQLLITAALVEFGKKFFSYSGALLNFLLLAGELTWGKWRDEQDPAKIANLISMSSFLSLYLIYQLSRLAGIVDSLGILNGQVSRLGQLLNALETPRVTASKNARVPVYENSQSNEFRLVFKDFCGINPQGKILYNNFNLIIEPGTNVLISGCNGSGKSSLLRFITGLWTHQTEKSLIIQIPPTSLDRDRPFFMSCTQNAVLFSGSLLDLLGLKEIVPDDEESNSLSSQMRNICEALNLVGLKDLFLFQGSDLSSSYPIFTNTLTLTTWQTKMTPGQHQRLSLARAILHQPHLLALDETCLAMESQEVSDILLELKNRRITVIFIDPSSNTQNLNTDQNSFFKHTIKL